MTSFIFVMFGISINLLVALTAHRYWAVCRPTSYYVHKQAGHIKWVIAVCVSIGVVVGTLPATIGWNSGVFDGKCFLMDLISFGFLYLCCIWTLGATTIIIVLYGLIYKSISDYVRLELFVSKRLKLHGCLFFVDKKPNRSVCRSTTRVDTGPSTEGRGPDDQDHVADCRDVSGLLDANDAELCVRCHPEAAHPIRSVQPVARADHCRDIGHGDSYELSHRPTDLRLPNERVPRCHNAINQVVGDESTQNDLTCSM